METVSYSIRINASKEKVWNTMLDSEKYKDWAKAFSSGSRFLGEWKQGTHIKFIDPDLGGTKAFLEEVTPYHRIHARHVAIVDKDGNEDTESDLARTWMSLTETYEFNEVDGVTALSIEIHTHEDYEKMFNDWWPNALELLKDLCERQG